MTSQSEIVPAAFALADLFAPGPARIEADAGVAAPVYATLLGPFALQRDGAPLRLGRTGSVLELCRYLIAHAGRPVPRDELLELLWPAVDPGQSGHRLHVTVSELRRLVDRPGTRASLVALVDDCYLLDGRAVLSDCDLFERRYHRGRAFVAAGDREGAAAAFGEALALYRGDYMADHPYAEWTQLRRAHFVERRLDALTYLCEHAAARGDLASVEEHARSILAVDRLRERAHRQLMRRHYRLGQRGCAVRQYRDLVVLLGRELGVRPSPLTERLHTAIVADSELPDEPALFVGPRGGG